MKLWRVPKTYGLMKFKSFLSNALGTNKIRTALRFILTDSLLTPSIAKASNLLFNVWIRSYHYRDAIMGTMASQTTSFTIVYSTVYSGADQRRHQSSASLAFVGNSPVTGDLRAQMASNAENVSIWWRQHDSIIITGKFILRLLSRTT